VGVFGIGLAGLVDSAPEAAAAGQKFAASGLDLIVCYAGTYATFSQVLPVVQRAKLPVLVLNLQPSVALDYANTDTGEWLANCSTCCVPEISNAFARARIRFRVVSRMLCRDALAWNEIEDWCHAVRVAAGLDRLVEEFDLDGLTYYCRVWRAISTSVWPRAGSSTIPCLPRAAC
jgi:L-arabinose isomerase